MQKHVDKLEMRQPLWLPQSRWPVYGEEMVTYSTPTGAVVFADTAFVYELFIVRSARIRALGRGMWHTSRGVSECAFPKVWYLRYERRWPWASDSVCMLDTFDASWNRTTIRRNALVPGMRFVYEG